MNDHNNWQDPLWRRDESTRYVMGERNVNYDGCNIPCLYVHNKERATMSVGAIVHHW